jgi:HK97 family phage prohead protease
MKIERRTFKVEVRKGAAGRKINGTAVVYNSLSEDLGGYKERINPSAFAGADITDVRCLINHDGNKVLGRTTSRTLVLANGPKGMGFTCDPPDTSYARDLAVSMDRGDIDQCSFAFTVPPGGATWESLPDGSSVRTVNKISRLYDVSVVTFPAYAETSSGLRSVAEIMSERPAGKIVPRSSGGASIDLLRRRLELEYYGRGYPTGKPTPRASSGGVASIDLLRRKLELEFYGRG